MKNIKKGIVVIVFMLSIVMIKAQEENRREKMEALKIAYITEKIDLSESEAKEFWPVFNEYQKERKNIRTRKKGKEKPNFDEMSDSEVEAFIDKRILNAERMLALRKKYLEKFKSILPIKKVAKLLEAERGFKREVLKKMRHKKD